MPSSPRLLHRSEIMTSGWCGGGWLDWQSRRQRPKLEGLTCARHGCSRYQSAQVPSCGDSRGPGSCRARAAGDGVAGSTPVRRHRPVPVRSRRGTVIVPRAPMASGQNHDRPARREPHFYLRTIARGKRLAVLRIVPSPGANGRRMRRHARFQIARDERRIADATRRL